MQNLQLPGDQVTMRGFLLSQVIKVWQTEARKFCIKETGGILIGYWDKLDNIVITHATGPGPNAEHSYNHFAPDHHYCQQILETVFEQSGGELTYIGDWHTHPWGSVLPSRRDRRTAAEVASDIDFKCSRPLIAIYRPAGRILRVERNASFGMWVADSDATTVEVHIASIIDEIPGYSLPNQPD